MVKLKGPNLSTEATGSLAGQIIFQTWRGRPYLRKLTPPSNPKSPMQTSMRVMLSAITKDWPNLSATQKAYWDELAGELNISPIAAYTKFNIERWRRFKPPVINPADTDESESVPSTLNFGVTGNVRHVTLLLWWMPPISEGWGCVIFRDPVLGSPNTIDRVKKVLLWHDMLDKKWIDSSLTPGTYHYTYRAFSLDGNFGTAPAKKSATVT